jgi:hypothetical protein
MRHALGHRKTADLSDSLLRQLNSYALVATASGVGMLALVQPADAKIIYTPVHVVIGPRQTYNIVFDRVSEFQIFNDCGTYNSGRHIGVVAVNVSTARNAVKGTSTADRNSVFRLPAGYVIGPTTRQTSWGPGGQMAYNVSGRFSGNWQNGRRAAKGYLGLEFVIKGKLHYGWARLTVGGGADPNCFKPTVFGYAYETIPGKAIIAGATKGPGDAEPIASNTPIPEPAMLATLALGAPGLSIWRREETGLPQPKRN